MAGLRLIAVALLAVCVLTADSGFVRNRVAVDGAEISYLVRQRSGPVLVLVPGSFVGAEDWNDVVAALDPKVTIMTVELRGHGESWPPPVHGTVESLSADVMAAIDHARISRFYIGGHSIGGMIAIEIGGHHPERVKGILAIEGWTDYSVALNAWEKKNDKELVTDAQLARREELRKPVMSRWTPEQVKEFATIWRHWNGYELLNQARMPVLELWGDRNQPHPSRAAMQIPEHANIELEWVEGASHFLPQEHPTDVAKAVNAFLHRAETAEGNKTVVRIPLVQ
jgi:pimeloyl-ACP methyl ester carboxylesterase